MDGVITTLGNEIIALNTQITTKTTEKEGFEDFAAKKMASSIAASQAAAQLESLLGPRTRWRPPKRR